MSRVMRICIAVGFLAILGGCGLADEVSLVTEEDAPDLPVRSITAGEKHACARVGGDIFCWGFHGDKRLGEKRNNLATNPIEVPNNVDALDVTAGAAHTCAGQVFSSNGGAGCWGKGNAGQLGRGTPGLPKPLSKEAKSQPDPDLNGARVVDVAAGARHSCAALGGGDIKCWGDDSSGQLGSGPPPSSKKREKEVIRNTPQLVLRIGAKDDPDRQDEGALGPAIDVSAGGTSTCALLENGEVYCWGEQTGGKLGNGVTAETMKNSPVQVQGINNATAISVGLAHACAALENGEAKCWGQNDLEGKLGDGSQSTSSTPVTVKNLPGRAIDISAGYDHTCAVVIFSGFETPGGPFISETQVQCWGDDKSGELGDAGSTGLGQFSRTPVKVVEITDAAGVAVGRDFSCALLGDSDSEEIRCWGLGIKGQLGDGTTSGSTVPVQVNIPNSP